MNALRQMLGSKKAIAMFASVGAVLLGKLFELELPPEELAVILTPVIAYILGQGVADHGKEKAKLEAKP